MTLATTTPTIETKYTFKVENTECYLVSKLGAYQCSVEDVDVFPHAANHASQHISELSQVLLQQITRAWICQHTKFTSFVHPETCTEL